MHNMNDPIKLGSIKVGQLLLHGDVILFRENIDSFDNLPKLNTNVIMTGETNHAHVLIGDNFDLREDPKTKVKYLRLVEPVALRHEEHREITLPPGEYRIGVQREYDPFEKLTRQVAD